MRGLKNLTDVIFPFSCTSLSLYRCDTATFSASESKNALNGFLKDASLSPTLNLLTFVVHAISSFEMKTRGFEIVADVIVQFSRRHPRAFIEIKQPRFRPRNQNYPSWVSERCQFKPCYTCNSHVEFFSRIGQWVGGKFSLMSFLLFLEHRCVFQWMWHSRLFRSQNPNLSLMGFIKMPLWASRKIFVLHGWNSFELERTWVRKRTWVRNSRWCHFSFFLRILATLPRFWPPNEKLILVCFI